MLPSPGGEGAERSEADEVEKPRYRRNSRRTATSSVGCAASFPSRGSLWNQETFVRPLAVRLFHLALNRGRAILTASEETRCILFPPMDRK